MSQDWEPVVIRKRAPNSAAKRDEKTVNAARRAGADIETVRKCFVLSPLLSSSLFSAPHSFSSAISRINIIIIYLVFGLRFFVLD